MARTSSGSMRGIGGKELAHLLGLVGVVVEIQGPSSPALRLWFLLTLPAALRGSTSTNRTDRGSVLKFAKCSRV